MRVLVLGAGVIGLTVAVRLAESGHEVNIVARDLPAETTSAVAAALWYPFRIQPLDRALLWSVRSLAEFRRIADTDSDAGVVLRHGTELLRRPEPDPWWSSAVPELERLGQVPPPFRDGWSFTAPLVEMPIYLGWLSRRLFAAGGTITRMSLPSLPSNAELVVNCSGLGALGLAHDPSVRPVRGQVLLLEQVGVESWTLDGGGLTYVVPRSGDIVVGGTDVEGDWDRGPDPVVAASILERATTLVPALARAAVLSHRVGLRPGRPEVRLQAERLTDGGTVIHCYGHGGAGVTVSWGCADEVAALAESQPAT